MHLSLLERVNAVLSKSDIKKRVLFALLTGARPVDAKHRNQFES
jgi:hypothetical protein